MKDDLNIFEMEDNQICLKMEDNLVFFNGRLPKNWLNGCGTAPGNLVLNINLTSLTVSEVSSKQ
jgi:hypothetical protein